MNDAEPLMTTIEAASRLHVSPSWLKKQAAAGQVPHVRLGRSVRFTTDNVDAIIAAGQSAASRRRRSPP